MLLKGLMWRGLTVIEKLPYGLYDCDTTRRILIQTVPTIHTLSCVQLNKRCFNRKWGLATTDIL